MAKRGNAFLGRYVVIDKYEEGAEETLASIMVCKGGARNNDGQI